MKLILDTVGQGFLRVAPDGSLSAERSAILGEWLGAPLASDRMWDYFGRTDPGFGECVYVGLESVVEDFLPLELSLNQMPKQLRAGNRTLSVGYRPILEGSKLESIVVIVSDITSEVARRDAEAETSDAMAVFERVLRDRAGFNEFLVEAGGIVQTLSRPETPVVDVRRLLHTLKGNSLIVGMGGFARACHALESSMEETGEALSNADRALLVERWHVATSRTAALLGDGVPRIEMSEADCGALTSAVLDGVPRGAIVRMIEDLKLEPARRRLERIAEDARGIAKRLGKADLRVDIDAADVRFSRERWSPLWSSVTHLVRNALDHGIEPADARSAAGKPAWGTLTLSTRIDGDELVIALADDGRGVDWAEIRKLAERKGLPHATHEDLEAALFSDGLSTKRTVTEYSGRGVGMSAVAAATKDLGGRIRVHSDRSRGTRVELRFPRASVRSVRRRERTTSLSSITVTRHGSAPCATVRPEQPGRP